MADQDLIALLELCMEQRYTIGQTLKMIREEMGWGTGIPAALSEFKRGVKLLMDNPKAVDWLVQVGG
jgi:hypothetical protein